MDSATQNDYEQILRKLQDSGKYSDEEAYSIALKQAQDAGAARATNFQTSEDARHAAEAASATAHQNVLDENKRAMNAPPPLAPTYGGYQAQWQLDPNTGKPRIGTLADNLRVDNGQWGNSVNPAQMADWVGTTTLNDQGQTKWGALQEQMQRKQQGLDLGNLQQQGAGQAAMGRSALAARGGLRSGSAERMGGSIGRGVLLGGQNLASQGQLARLASNSADTTQRNSALQSIVGRQSENQLANANLAMSAKNADITRSLGEMGRESQAKQFGYGEDVKKWLGQLDYQGKLKTQPT